MPPPKYELGTWLNELLARSGISQQILARALGVSVDEINRWQLNEDKPSRDILLTIILLLGSLEGDASTLLRSAGYEQLTEADKTRFSALASNPDFEEIIRVRKAYQALSNATWNLHQAESPAALTQQLETQLKNIQALLQAQQDQATTIASSPQLTNIAVDLLAQAQQTAQRLSADVILPSPEEMQVKLVSANSFERLEEYRSEENKWFSVAGIFIGVILGVLVNVITGGTITTFAIFVVSVSLGLSILMLRTASDFGNRARALRNRIIGRSPPPTG